MSQFQNSNEIWKGIPDYEGIYQASNFGRIKSLQRTIYVSQKQRLFKERILKGKINSNGYHQVELFASNNSRQLLIHRIVALLFKQPLHHCHEVNHKDGDKLNNHESNLEWVTHQANIDHAVATGLKNSKGSEHYNSKKVVDVLTGKVFDYMGQAAKEHGLSVPLLSMYLNGKRTNLTTLKYLQQ